MKPDIEDLKLLRAELRSILTRLIDWEKTHRADHQASDFTDLDGGDDFDAAEAFAEMADDLQPTISTLEGQIAADAQPTMAERLAAEENGPFA